MFPEFQKYQEMDAHDNHKQDVFQHFWIWVDVPIDVRECAEKSVCYVFCEKIEGAEE